MCLVQTAWFLLPTACENRQDSAANLTSPNGSNSISMSVEINGIMYTGRNAGPGASSSTGSPGLPPGPPSGALPS